MLAKNLYSVTKHLNNVFTLTNLSTYAKILPDLYVPYVGQLCHVVNNELLYIISRSV